MLNVHNDDLVVEAKGIYSIENFIVARRLMYWQVYLHKTSLAADLMLGKILKRARYVVSKRGIATSKALYFFLKNKVNSEDDMIAQFFSRLDDFDIMAAIKQWQYDQDVVLSDLSSGLVNRNLFKIVLQNRPFSEEKIDEIKNNLTKMGVQSTHVDYYVITGKVQNFAYDTSRDNIKIMNENLRICDISIASDQFISHSSAPVEKYYLCYKRC